MSKIATVAWLVTYVAAFLNIFIYTYPNVNPKQCSWSFKNETLKYPITEYLTQIPFIGERVEFYLPKNEVKQVVPDIKMLAFGDPQINGNWKSTPYIKRLDNFGNDHYLGHIYHVMKKRLEPTHVAVLGDLFSSQWILDSEFFNRTRRYVTRLFPQPEEHRKHVLEAFEKHEPIDWIKFMDEVKATPLEDLRFDFEDIYDWTSPVMTYTGEPLFINLTGNHDIGYAGDATWQHMARFHQLFGKDNFWIEYDRETSHPWRIVVLNSLTLEGPALQEEFVQITWEFLRQLEERKFNGSTVLLTHVPFYKREGLCTDGPQTIYYENYEREPYKNGLLRSQNHLSYETSQKVLDQIFGNGKSGIILTGHDHEGCENYYNKNQETGEWKAEKEVESSQYIREVTVRAMMGDFDGNTGIMTAHWNSSKEAWDYDFNLCPFVVQHVWWVAQVFSLGAALLQSAVMLFKL